MFGTNKLAQNETHADGATISVKEIFATIQGEGPFAGMPAIFIRLAGCNLACHYCDTDFVDGHLSSVSEVVDACTAATEGGRYSLVVITGGEPMRQNIAPLCDLLFDLGWQVQVETAGTLWPLRLNPAHVSLVCSPKTKSIHPTVAALCREFKYVVGVGDSDPVDGLPMMSTQRKGQRDHIYRPKDDRARIWLQPRMDYTDHGGVMVEDKIATRANQDLCAALCMKHDYRISIQQHKLLNLP